MIVRSRRGRTAREPGEGELRKCPEVPEPPQHISSQLSWSIPRDMASKSTNVSTSVQLGFIVTTEE